MDTARAWRAFPLVILAASAAAFSGCTNYEVNTKRGDIPGYFIRYEMQEADRAVESARQAGKDKMCPDEFKAAEDAKNHAYDVFRACRTEEGAALAKQATAQANALCSQRMAKEVPPSAPAPPPPAPAPAPAPPAPTDKLTASPASIPKGDPATLAWSSRNASLCDLQPGIGPVPAEGSMQVTPAGDTTYTLTCSGEGGEAKSSAEVRVAAPQPKPEAKLCSPTVINIRFDTNKYDIKPRYHEELKKLADFLKEFPQAKGVIEGHTDSVGSMAGNMKLSQQRAESVRTYLIEKFGIAPDRIGAKGFGPTKPVADNKTAAGREQNRRIETNFSCTGS